MDDNVEVTAPVATPAPVQSVHSLITEQQAHRRIEHAAYLADLEADKK